MINALNCYVQGVYQYDKGENDELFDIGLAQPIYKYILS